MTDHQDIANARTAIKADLAAYKMPEDRYETGRRRVSLLLNTADAGAAVPLHRHTVEESVMMFEGRIWVRIGDQEYEIGPGETVIIPPNTPHVWGNTGPVTARMLWVWGGADPFGSATYLQGEPPKVNG